MGLSIASDQGWQCKKEKKITAMQFYKPICVHKSGVENGDMCSG